MSILEVIEKPTLGGVESLPLGLYKPYQNPFVLNDIKCLHGDFQCFVLVYCLFFA